MSITIKRSYDQLVFFRSLISHYISSLSQVKKYGPTPAEKRWNMKAVFWPGVLEFFHGGFRPFPGDL